MGVSVINASLATYFNNTVVFDIQIVSDSNINCSLLLSTDRFTEVYSLLLKHGLNDEHFNFPAEDNSNWTNLAQARATLLVDNQIIYSKEISPLNVSSVNISVMIIVGLIFILFISVMLYAKRRNLNLGLKTSFNLIS